MALADAKRGACTPGAEARCQTIEQNGGQTERRPCTVLDDSGLGEWAAAPKSVSGQPDFIAKGVAQGIHTLP